MQLWVRAVQKAIDRQFDEMVAIRRHLHAHPELSGKEHDTSLYLYQRFSDLGFDVRIGPEGRGVVADQRHPRTNPSDGLLALRADIDALRIHDQKDVDYHSQCPGVMHACGHDVHTAICFGCIGLIM